MLPLLILRGFDGNDLLRELTKIDGQVASIVPIWTQAAYYQGSKFRDQTCVFGGPRKSQLVFNLTTYQPKSEKDSTGPQNNQSGQCPACMLWCKEPNCVTFGLS